jgi:hypothetical protein
MPQNDFFRISLPESKNAPYLKTSSRVSDIYSFQNINKFINKTTYSNPKRGGFNGESCN